MRGYNTAIELSIPPEARRDVKRQMQYIQRVRDNLNPKIVIRNDNFARRVTNADCIVSIVRINPDIENERKTYNNMKV
jgi:hypothetical protein